MALPYVRITFMCKWIPWLSRLYSWANSYCLISIVLVCIRANTNGLIVWVSGFNLGLVSQKGDAHNRLYYRQELAWIYWLCGFNRLLWSDNQQERVASRLNYYSFACVENLVEHTMRSVRLRNRMIFGGWLASYWLYRCVVLSVQAFISETYENENGLFVVAVLLSTVISASLRLTIRVRLTPSFWSYRMTVGSAWSFWTCENYPYYYVVPQERISLKAMYRWSVYMWSSLSLYYSLLRKLWAVIWQACTWLLRLVGSWIWKFKGWHLAISQLI